MVAFAPFGRIFLLAFSLPSRNNNERIGQRFDPAIRTPQTVGRSWRFVRLRSHSAVISPIASASDSSGSFPALFPDDPTPTSVSHLCDLLGATPDDLLRLESTSDGVRGVYLNRPVKKDEVVLSVPLDSCLQDDDPPDWFVDKEMGTTSYNTVNPNDWAPRLAASLLDLQLRRDHHDGIEKGKALWLSMLPDPKYLRASLPIHWTEDILRSAGSTALELSVDSAYFARAQAVEDLMAGLKRFELAKNQEDEDLRTMCHNALDVVQTRSCRVEREDGIQWGAPLRILAPVFDFINHGSCKTSNDGSANAFFELEGGDITDLEGPSLVVRATLDLDENEEILIDYGESARPAWKCLASYGFVPEYKSPAEEGGDGDEDDVAEVYMDGVRYEVGPSTIPIDMVQAVADSLHVVELSGGDLGVVGELLGNSFDSTVPTKSEELPKQVTEQAEAMLSPVVALRIAKRVSDAAFQLLLDATDDASNNDTDEQNRTPEELHSARLAASLRWAQHRILLACAITLRDWATRQT